MSFEPPRAQDKSRRGRWLDKAAAVAFIAVCLTYLWDRLGPPWPRDERSGSAVAEGVRTLPGAGADRDRLPTEPVPFAGEPRLGVAEARVGMEIYSDFHCPFCKKFADESLPQIKRDYVETGRIVIRFRHAPIETLHPYAVSAATAAECAGEQGRFWKMHDALLAGPREFGSAYAQGLVERLDLDTAAFAACVEGPAAVGRVRADRDAARRLGITGTPSFMFGTIEPDGRLRVTRRFGGALPVARFREALDEILGSQAAAAGRR